MAKIGFREWWAVGQAMTSTELLRYGAGNRFTSRFEKRFGAMIGSSQVLAVTSGTAALTTALAAAGIGPGDEVLVPAYTWMATATAPVMVGAVPVLVDIDDTLTMDPIDLEAKITPYTKAIIPVHMVNLPANMDAIMKIARKHNLIVIEDACQAVGVRYKDRFCGAIGDAGCFSFNPAKNMNIGEGGAIATSDPKLFRRALNYHDLGVWARNHKLDDAEPIFIGHNFRANEIQGAMLNEQLSRLQPMLNRMKVRRKIIADVIEREGNIRIAPHNDPENAVSLAVILDTEEEAIEFGKRRGAFRVFDNSKHIYTYWQAIMERRTAHPKMNPWAWANRDVSYSAESCARSLDILRRTCRIRLSENFPTVLAHRKAGRLAQPLSTGKRTAAPTATVEPKPVMGQGSVFAE
ncbi:MAG TPA: aminotransferase class I/II-fold pyridoxal phosphate-dependent enzyme [Hyphomonadaceae bacterium]|nr:aminotransferase class I/II-fold pyridoxal phosphate-dependent enzyme [Hyphomonadaceae bacterium]HPN04792.1 aminotransferase class I/II-fold pyridoxal phosphate-dependent enzyme [Hyphomonadaceae bacterium]